VPCPNIKERACSQKHGEVNVFFVNKILGTYQIKLANTVIDGNSIAFAAYRSESKKKKNRKKQGAHGSCLLECEARNSFSYCASIVAEKRCSEARRD